MYRALADRFGWPANVVADMTPHQQWIYFVDGTTPDGRSYQTIRGLQALKEIMGG